MNSYSVPALKIVSISVLRSLPFTIHTWMVAFSPCSQITVIAVIPFGILGHCVFLNSRVLQLKLKIVAPSHANFESNELSC